MTRRALHPFDVARLHPGLGASLGASQVVLDGNRIFISQQSGFALDGTFHGLGDAAAQAEQAMANLRALLAAFGASLEHVCKITTAITDRAYRPAVYEVVGRHLRGVFPVSTGLVVAGLAVPEMLVAIDIEAAIPEPDASHERLRRFTLKDWFGQPIDWQGCMVVKTNAETFLRGQTGSVLDGKTMVGLGRRPEDAAAQAELALTNLKTLLEEAGGSVADICKLTVYISDRAYRSAVYPVIGRHLRGVYPVSTGLIVPGFARPEILFELDAAVVPSRGAPHERFRKYHSSVALYGRERQPLECEFSMVVRAGDRIFLRGQTGIDLENRFQGLGNAGAQAELAMENIAALLGDAGARIEDVTKLTTYVTDRAYLAPVLAAIGRRLGDHRPATSETIIKGLASPELLVEIDATAVLPTR
jgi:enamine deaminase RidA (YjgF/YER057c/UK114 family)